jgi:hypothetical protein
MTTLSREDELHMQMINMIEDNDCRPMAEWADVDQEKYAAWYEELLREYMSNTIEDNCFRPNGEWAEVDQERYVDWCDELQLLKDK